MYPAKLLLSFFFMILQSGVLQIQAGVRSGFTASEIRISSGLFIGADKNGPNHPISPNDFKGSDTERIQAAVNAAKGTTNKIVIPMQNAKGGNSWKIDRAILLPSNMTVILDNCIIQLSDLCRDNMFRSDNVDGFKLKNVTIKNSHAWAICFERTRNAELSALKFINPEYIPVKGSQVKTYNKDGINLRHGCKYFRIDNITGINGDDLIALLSSNSG